MKYVHTLVAHLLVDPAGNQVVVASLEQALDTVKKTLLTIDEGESIILTDAKGTQVIYTQEEAEALLDQLEGAL